MNSFGSQKKPTGPLIVGLTGQTGAGKSTVTEAFAEKGFVVIDCDALTRELQTRPEVLSMLSQAYGPQILKEDGQPRPQDACRHRLLRAETDRKAGQP